ncbi:MAG: DNA polymerase III subunit psi [Thalassotalea sp.]
MPVTSHLTSKQFIYLNEMGISLWHRKASTALANSTTQQVRPQASTINSASQTALSQSASNKAVSPAPAIEHFLPIAQSNIENSQLFRDILQALSVDTANVAFTQKAIEFELFNWQLSAKPALTIEQQDTLLLTPAFEQIANSVALKKALWQALQTKL